MIAVIDYGVGNLRSVEKALHFIGADAVVTSDENVIRKASGVVLPGVGAFADAMERLQKAGLAGLVREIAASGKPFLGICLGMQLLFEYSEEGGERVPGLGVFKGAVKQIPGDMGLKVPHMGWNSLEVCKRGRLLDDLPAAPYVYFVHSYYVCAEDRSIVAATAAYGTSSFDVAVEHGSVSATQFHPEKSGEVGLKILKNWFNTFKEQD